MGDAVHEAGILRAYPLPTVVRSGVPAKTCSRSLLNASEKSVSVRTMERLYQRYSITVKARRTAPGERRPERVAQTATEAAHLLVQRPVAEHRDLGEGDREGAMDAHVPPARLRFQRCGAEQEVLPVSGTGVRLVGQAGGSELFVSHTVSLRGAESSRRPKSREQGYSPMQAGRSDPCTRRCFTAPVGCAGANPCCEFQKAESFWNDRGYNRYGTSLCPNGVA